ncbi:MAG TPA: hypothetical protein VFF44_14725, partial [Casimicrobiaceae bacterium]|nr:hypothetical protein [Casimicrobiaceae bacterium]
DRYDDIYHFDPAVNERLIEAACGGADRVDAGGARAFERQLREQLAAVSTPAGLAALIGGPPRTPR